MNNSKSDYRTSFTSDSFLFHSSEVFKIPAKLVGIYAIYNTEIIGGEENIKFIKLGYGNLRIELEKILTDPSVNKYSPSHFIYLLNPKKPEQKLQKLVEELNPVIV